MSALLAAGVACGGPPNHHRRHWSVIGDRKLRWVDPGHALDMVAPPSPEITQALREPIPGDAPVLLADPFRLSALLANGDAYWLDARGRPQWRQANQEGSMKGEAAYVSGGTTCKANWVAAADRRLWTWSLSGRAALAEAPVPGTARILAVDVVGKVVLLDDGQRLALVAGRWASLPGFVDGSGGKVRLRCVSGFCIGGERGDLAAGDVIALSESEARPYLASGRLEIVEGAHEQ